MALAMAEKLVENMLCTQAPSTRISKVRKDGAAWANDNILEAYLCRHTIRQNLITQRYNTKCKMSLNILSLLVEANQDIAREHSYG